MTPLEEAESRPATRADHIVGSIDGMRTDIQGLRTDIQSTLKELVTAIISTDRVPAEVLKRTHEIFATALSDQRADFARERRVWIYLVAALIVTAMGIKWLDLDAMAESRPKVLAGEVAA
jgi:hypothetical protein